MSFHSDDEMDLVTAVNVDLSNCDREQVHAPELIQPHGVMLVLQPNDLIILQASHNTAAVFGVAAADLTMKPLASLVGIELAARLAVAIGRTEKRLDVGPLQIMPRIVREAGREALDVFAHRAGDVLILEFERTSSDWPPFGDFCADLSACIARLRATSGLKPFLDRAVTEVRAFTGFDRVMVYQFAPDGSGHVVAEARRDDLNTYLDHHFPASDIPAPARRLFTLSWLRHLPDANYTPVPLLPQTAKPVDMSHSLLRHVSAMYSGYLKNMGCHATMVMPLMKDGRLWGLISCMHHAGPLHVPTEIRNVNEILAQMVSLLMAEKADRDIDAYRRRMNEAIAGLQYQMEHDANFSRALTEGVFTLHGWLDATGVALVTEHGTILLGLTPTYAQVRGINAWLNGQSASSSIFATDRLAELYPPAEAFQATASGLLAAPLRHHHGGCIMWFRPEIPQTIAWAGDPHKPVEAAAIDGEQRLMPRVSFESWKETVRERCAPWLDVEIKAAHALRQAIREVALIRVNDDLQRSNADLDSFASAVSHDLKEPIRGISNFAQFLYNSAEARLTKEEQGRIQTILRLTRRMDDLTDALLLYSRVGRADFVVAAVDMEELLVRTLEALEPRLAELGVDVRVPRKLPTIQSDRIWLAEVMSNLISNAAKYNDRPPGQRWIEIGWQGRPERTTFYVRDNGIGIETKYLEDIFGMFRRLHGRDEYSGGNGAGLTIARRTLERLGGRLWAESEGPGKGSTFRFVVNTGQTGGAWLC